MSTFSPMALIERSEVSRIDLIFDHDPDGKSIHHWFLVCLEVPDNKLAQTIEFTVNYDTEWALLTEFLTMGGWTFDQDHVHGVHQGFGYGSRSVVFKLQ